MMTNFMIYVDEAIDGYRVDLVDYQGETEKLNPETAEELFRIINRYVKEQEAIHIRR
jgi:hypothetical protein